MTTSPARTSSARCGADQPKRRPATTSSRSSPAASPTAAAASALWTASRPSAGIVRDRRPARARSSKRMPSAPADSSEIGDLAAHIHTHLEDGCLVFGPHPQDRQRQSDLVVLVALGLERREAGRQDGGDRLL